MVPRLIPGALLLCALGFLKPLPLMASDPLQCVPYARAVSGVDLHGDAWTWWAQAEGRYARGHMPLPGAVLSLANTVAMPLGHVAVVTRIVDERHILLRHANWSAPGRIEEDVMAVDSSIANDWSQVRIWWGQTQQMGARDNPVNGFIYPNTLGPAPQELAPGRRWLFARADPAPSERPQYGRPAAAPRLSVDNSIFRSHSDMQVARANRRSLADIIMDVKRSGTDL